MNIELNVKLTFIFYLFLTSLKRLFNTFYFQKKYIKKIVFLIFIFSYYLLILL